MDISSDKCDCDIDSDKCTMGDARNWLHIDTNNLSIPIQRFLVRYVNYVRSWKTVELRSTPRQMSSAIKGLEGRNNVQHEERSAHSS